MIDRSQLTLAWNIGIYFVPPWLSYQILTRRSDFLTSTNLAQGVKYLTGVGVVYLVTHFLIYTLQWTQLNEITLG
jgi:hypothetical protein